MHWILKKFPLNLNGRKDLVSFVYLVAVKEASITPQFEFDYVCKNFVAIDIIISIIIDKFVKHDIESRDLP